jgi:hypothetical protein
MARGILYEIVTTIENYQAMLGGLLIASSLGLLCLETKSERQIYTLKLPSTDLDQDTNYIDFTKQQFTSGTPMEVSYAVETNRGTTIVLRPTHYHLTVTTKTARIFSAASVKAVKVVELWSNGEKQGYFDFHQNKYIIADVAVGQSVSAQSAQDHNDFSGPNRTKATMQ